MCQKEEIDQILKYGGRLFSNVKETLQELSLYNNLYIVSNCQKGYIEAFLSYYKLNEELESNIIEKLNCKNNIK